MEHPSLHRARALIGALAGLLLVTFAARSNAASVLNRPGEPPGTRPDVHFGVAVALDRPQLWGDVDTGYSVAARFEVELSPWYSPFVEASLGEVTGPVRVYFPYAFANAPGPPVTTRTERSFNSVGIGVRALLLRRALVRPTVEAGFAVRFVGDATHVYGGYNSNLQPLAGFDDEGHSTFVRLGFTTAPRHGAGVFADVGWEFVTRNPTRYGVVPFRLGVLFP